MKYTDLYAKIPLISSEKITFGLMNCSMPEIFLIICVHVGLTEMIDIWIRTKTLLGYLSDEIQVGCPLNLLLFLGDKLHAFNLAHSPHIVQNLSFDCVQR